MPDEGGGTYTPHQHRTKSKFMDFLANVLAMFILVVWFGIGIFGHLGFEAKGYSLNVGPMLWGILSGPLNWLLAFIAPPFGRWWDD